MTSEELKQARKELGLTQRELAQRLGVSRNCITRWEIGMHRIPFLAGEMIKIIVEAKAMFYP